MLHVGYGKQDPETMVDVWVTMISLLMGTTMWLILGSIITTLLIHLNAAHSEYTAKMTALSQYMMENNLPQVFSCAFFATPYARTDIVIEFEQSWHGSMVFPGSWLQCCCVCDNGHG